MMELALVAIVWEGRHVWAPTLIAMDWGCRPVVALPLAEPLRVMDFALIAMVWEGRRVGALTLVAIGWECRSVVALVLTELEWDYPPVGELGLVAMD